MVKFLCSFRTIKYPQISWCGIRVILQIAIDVEKKAPLSSESIFLSKASWFGPKNGAGYEESRGTSKTKKKINILKFSLTQTPARGSGK